MTKDISPMLAAACVLMLSMSSLAFSNPVSEQARLIEVSDVGDNQASAG
jgi:hypothetical protein